MRYKNEFGIYPDEDEETKNKFYKNCARKVDRICSVLDNPTEVTDEFRIERINAILDGD